MNIINQLHTAEVYFFEHQEKIMYFLPRTFPSTKKSFISGIVSQPWKLQPQAFWPLILNRNSGSRRCLTATIQLYCVVSTIVWGPIQPAIFLTYLDSAHPPPPPPIIRAIY